MSNFPRPSASHQWYYCNGAFHMQEDLPNEESDATREGTACHWVAEQLLNRFVKPTGLVGMPSDYIDTLAPNDVLITEEMFQCALDYTTDVMGKCRPASLRDLHIEESINLDVIYPGMKGTPDAWIYIAETFTLKLWDLKYGHGHVEVFENPQFLIYVAGILNKLAEKGINIDFVTVEMIVFQPRSYSVDGPVRSWVQKANLLRAYFNKLEHAAQEAMGKYATCNPGKHCLHCRAKFCCEALQLSTYKIVDVVNQGSGVNKVVLKEDSLALELKLLRHASELLKYRLASIETQVESELRSGKNIPGFIVNQKYGRKRWLKDAPTSKVLMMADLMGVDLRKPDNLDTPAQAIAKFKKHKIDDVSLINQYTETPTGGFEVVEDDGSKMRQAFGKNRTGDAQ